MKDDEKTKERISKAAESLFAAHGFRKVTVREICRAAEANVAAVNYYFGDKVGLYREVLRAAIEAMRGTTEAAREAGRGQPPAERLRRFISIFMQRLLRPGHETVHRLINREMMDPTPAFDALVDQGVRPRVEYLSGVVAEMLGCDPKDERALRCVASIQSQAIFYLPNPIAARLGFRFEPTPAQIQDAARHIAVFSLAGVHAIGRATGAGVPAGRRGAARLESRRSRTRPKRRVTRDPAAH